MPTPTVSPAQATAWSSLRIKDLADIMQDIPGVTLASVPGINFKEEVITHLKSAEEEFRPTIPVRNRLKGTLQFSWAEATHLQLYAAAQAGTLEDFQLGIGDDVKQIAGSAYVVMFDDIPLTREGTQRVNFELRQNPPWDWASLTTSDDVAAP